MFLMRLQIEPQARRLDAAGARVAQLQTRGGLHTVTGFIVLYSLPKRAPNACPHTEAATVSTAMMRGSANACRNAITSGTGTCTQATHAGENFRHPRRA
jgi:hypothetical protein